jgi:hypothetical protein
MPAKGGKRTFGSEETAAVKLGFATTTRGYRSDLSSRSAIYLCPSRSHEFQEAPFTVLQCLLDAQQCGVFSGALWCACSDYIPQTRKSTHGMLGIIVVPWHAVVIKEREQFVSVLFNSFPKGQSGLRRACHGNDVLNESFG